MGASFPIPESANRRAFLSSLAALPMLGGSVKLVGQPTAAAVPTSTPLLENYEAFLAWERYRLQRELWGEDMATKATTFLRVNVAAERWHRPLSGVEACPEPSTRAALILSAAGVPLFGGIDG